MSPPSSHSPSARSGIRLDPKASDSLFKQIFDQIVARIRSGAFPAGYRLPPTRSLAGELDTHRNTVVRAYEELEDAGFVTSTVGRGTFVAPQPANPATASAEPPQGALPWATLVSRASLAEPLGRSDRLSQPPPRLGAAPINLTRMQPSPDLLPADLLRRCIDHVLRSEGSRALGYAPREGLPRLRRRIAEDLQRQGIPASDRDILVTSGSQQGLDLIVRALVNPGDTFLIDSSTYTGTLNLLSAAGARLVGVPTDAEGPDPATLERLARSRPAKGLYLMPNCHNPTGAAISAARREALVAWSRRAGIPIIEDDYAADLNLEGTPPPPALRTLDGDVIYVGTYSKKLIPSLRVGFLVAPAAFMPRLVALKHAMDLGTSCVLQHALAEFLDRGYLRAHLGRTLPEYRRRRDALCGALAHHLPRSIRFTPPRHGVLLWLPLPASLDPVRVFEEAQRRGVMVSPSTLNAVDDAVGGGIRLTFCAEPPDRLAEGGRRLAQAITAVAVRNRAVRSDKPAAAFEIV